MQTIPRPSYHAGETDVTPGDFSPPRLVRLTRDAAGNPVERELRVEDATMFEAAEYALRLREYARRVEDDVTARIDACCDRVTALCNEREVSA